VISNAAVPIVDPRLQSLGDTHIALVYFVQTDKIIVPFQDSPDASFALAVTCERCHYSGCAEMMLKKDVHEPTQARTSI
jgi:hypothetical protein